MKSKDTKRQEAQKRNEAWAGKSPKDQLADLDKAGLVAKKQRAKIAKLL